MSKYPEAKKCAVHRRAGAIEHDSKPHTSVGKGYRKGRKKNSQHLNSDVDCYFCVFVCLFFFLDKSQVYHDAVLKRTLLEAPLMNNFLYEFLSLTFLVKFVFY